MAMRVIVIEDEKEHALVVQEAVERVGGTCVWITNYDDAFDEIRDANPPYHVIILDRMLYDGRGDAIDLIPALRDAGFITPVIVASNLSDAASQIDGFNAGAVHYLPKPIAPEILTAMIRSLTEHHRFEIGALELDGPKGDAFWRGERMQLPPKCFAILHLLALARGRPVGRSAIHRFAWKDDRTIDRQRVDQAISRLRRELDYFGATEIVELVEGVGYRLKTEALELAPADADQ